MNNQELLEQWGKEPQRYIFPNVRYDIQSEKKNGITFHSLTFKTYLRIQSSKGKWFLLHRKWTCTFINYLKVETELGEFNDKLNDFNVHNMFFLNLEGEKKDSLIEKFIQDGEAIETVNQKSEEERFFWIKQGDTRVACLDPVRRIEWMAESLRGVPFYKLKEKYGHEK